MSAAVNDLGLSLEKEAEIAARVRAFKTAHPRRLGEPVEDYRKAMRHWEKRNAGLEMG